MMKSKVVFLLGVSLVLATALMSCGKKQETSEAPASPAGQVGKPVDASTPGSITGTAQLDGQVTDAPA